MNRPRSHSIAAILHFLLSVGAIALALPLLSRGAEAIAEAGDAPPYFIVLLMLIVGVLGIVSTYGVWRMQKWGVVLTLLLRVVDGIAALPGVLFAPTTQLKVSAGIGVLLGVVVIVLLLRREPSSPESPGMA